MFEFETGVNMISVNRVDYRSPTVTKFLIFSRPTMFMSEPNGTHRGVGSESSYISVICNSFRRQRSIIIVVFYEKRLF